MAVEVILTLFAFATMIGTAIAVPMTYLFGVDHITLPNGYGDISLVAVGFWFAIALVGSNILSGLNHSTSSFLNTMDKIGSWIGLVSVAGTAVIFSAVHWLGFAPGLALGKHVADVAAVNGSIALLFGLLAYMVFDLLVIQRLKDKEVIRFQHQRTLANWATAHGAQVSGRTGEILHSVPQGTPENPPSGTQELGSRSGRPDAVVRKQIVIDEDNPEVFVRRGGRLIPIADASDVAKTSPRQVARVGAYLENPGSVPTQVIDLGPGDYFIPGHVVDVPDSPADDTDRGTTH